MPLFLQAEAFGFFADGDADVHENRKHREGQNGLSRAIEESGPVAP
jgi:hypothetical protein